MSQHRRLRAVEKKLCPPSIDIHALLLDWLQDENYVEPEFTGKVIKPRGYLTMQPDGSVKYES